jgi:uncharacterized protein YfiM (DUF2279 family)
LDKRIKILILPLVLIYFIDQNLYSQSSKSFNNFSLSEYSDIQKTIRPPIYKQILTIDKAKHLVGSMIGTVLIYELSNVHLDIESRESKTISVGIMLSFGVGKEFWDKKRKSTGFSWTDLLADGAGIAFGLILVNQP